MWDIVVLKQKIQTQNFQLIQLGYKYDTLRMLSTNSYIFVTLSFHPDFLIFTSHQMFVVYTVWMVQGFECFDKKFLTCLWRKKDQKHASEEGFDVLSTAL